jgi:UDP-GlcNAc3NAcA epimerase
VVGARPQFVKAGMVSRALRCRPEIEESIVHTGQHYDRNMSQVFFAELDIPAPAYELGIGSGTHGSQTGRMLEEIEKVLLQERPDWVVVYGDTNSTLAGALAAAKLNIPLAHVEAGLRSFNRTMPEEKNRVLTDHVSDLLFAPTSLALANLAREGLDHSGALLVGDVMYDAALYYGDRAGRQSRVLEQLKIRPGQYILATVHRAENTNSEERLRTILTGLRRISHDIPVVFPIHPRTQKAMLEAEGCTDLANGIQFTEPVSYLDMAMLEKNARAIVTDSGGMQKEAFFFCVPCITLRGETEWQELIDMGWNRLAPPTDPANLQSALELALVKTPTSTGNPYGDGHSAERIVNHLLEWGPHKPASSSCVVPEPAVS